MPNYSFKPTPDRGFAHVATLSLPLALPLPARLNSNVRSHNQHILFNPEPKMKDYFPNSVVAELQRFSQTVMRQAFIGEKELQILSLFYDERLKARRDLIPKFQIFGVLCDGKLNSGWEQIMIEAEMALGNLRRIEWIEIAQLSVGGNAARNRVGPAIETYRLTASGLEVLQKFHPSIALKFRGLLANMPPWLVLTGSVAGAVTAIWKVVELLLFALR